MVAVDGVVIGIAELMALSAASVVILLAALRIDRVGASIATAFRRVFPAKQAPSGPPLERIVADIRRLAAAIDALPPRAPFVKRKGYILAYDRALGAACSALGIEDDLQRVSFGPARDMVRLRVEAELACAGLVLESPHAA
jgi:hypothetical protein